MPEPLLPCPFCGGPGKEMSGPGGGTLVRCAAPPCTMSLHGIAIQDWQRRAGLSPTARTEIEAAFLERVRTALCDACVLMHGWHQDGTDWSAWDESVYKAAQAALAETMERASVLGAESTKETK